MDMHVHPPQGSTDSKTSGEGASSKIEVAGGLKHPVCGMAVTTESANKLEHDGTAYYFCSARCQSKFAADPLAYIGKQASSKVLEISEVSKAPAALASNAALGGMALTLASPPSRTRASG